MIWNGRGWLRLFCGAIVLLSMSASANASCTNLQGAWSLFAISGKPTEKDETVTKCELTVASNGNVSGPCTKFKSALGGVITKNFTGTGRLQLSGCTLSGKFVDSSQPNVAYTTRGGQLNGFIGSGIATNSKGYVFYFTLVKK